MTIPPTPEHLNEGITPEQSSAANKPPVPPPMVTYAGPMTGRYVPSQDERSMAMLVWLLGLVSGWIGPLILWLVKREQSRFIDFHGKQALYLHIALVVAIMVMVFVIWIPFVGCFAIIFVFPALIVVGIGSIVLQIIAAVRANAGEWYRLPLIGQWV